MMDHMMEHRGRSGRSPQPPRTLAARSDAAPQAPGPLIVRFLDENDDSYRVGDPWSERTAQVPKQRSFIEPYSPDDRRRGASGRLLRWSSYALVGSIFGGVLGVALGIIVALAALVRLTGLSGRIHRWRRRQRASGGRSVLPLQATRERIQLLAALGQGVVAMLLGSAVVFIILEMR